MVKKVSKTKSKSLKELSYHTPELLKEGSTQEQIKTLTQIMFAVVIILLVAVGAMFATVGSLVWNAHNLSTATYQELLNELEEQNDKIDIILEKVSETK